MNKLENLENVETLRIAGVVKESTVDGPGFRYVIFTQGCPHKCEGCHNPETHDFNGGKVVPIDDIIKDIERNPLLAGVTISGGEPLLQAKFLIELFTKLKEYEIHTCIDTSGSFDLTDDIKKLIDLTDLFLLDIKCINDQKSKELTGVSKALTRAELTCLSSR